MGIFSVTRKLRDGRDEILKIPQILILTKARGCAAAPISARHSNSLPVIPILYPAIPIPYPAIPVLYPVIPALYPVIPAKAGIQSG